MWLLKRNDNQSTLKLHQQFYWSDEYDWTPLVQSNPVFLLSGAMDIQQGLKLAGRPITLKGDYAYITRGDVKLLQSWANVPELTLTLTHPNQQQYAVIFKRPFIDNIKAIKPVRPNDELDNDKMTANIHLICI